MKNCKKCKQHSIDLKLFFFFGQNLLLRKLKKEIILAIYIGIYKVKIFKSPVLTF